MGRDKGGQGGVVVNIGSSASFRPQVFSPPIYTATKHAILGLSRSCGVSFHQRRLWHDVCLTKIIILCRMRITTAHLVYVSLHYVPVYYALRMEVPSQIITNSNHQLMRKPGRQIWRVLYHNRKCWMAEESGRNLTGWFLCSQYGACGQRSDDCYQRRGKWFCLADSERNGTERDSLFTWSIISVWCILL